MFAKALQQIFIFIAVVTSMGTLVHDTRLGRAVAVTVPLSGASIDVASNLESLSHGASHTHVEEVRVSDGVPTVQARDDHRRYLVSKYLNRSSNFTGDSAYLWPSI